jgi:hypothetical protein
MNPRVRLLMFTLLLVAATQVAAQQLSQFIALDYEMAGAAPLSQAIVSDHGMLAVTPVTPIMNCKVSIDHEPALVVRDPQVLAEFELPDVLDAIAMRSGIPGTTGADIWRRWWATQRERTSSDPSDEPRCTDNGRTINGYPIDCPRPEHELEALPSSSHRPVALFNRFDLARADGSTCGEYRIVYAFDGPKLGVSGRNFLILEAVLPNPNPSCGIAACKPVVELWAGLEDLDSAGQAEALRDFYFDGLDGFAPVIHPAHYGLGGGSGGYGTSRTGQFRTNQFITPGGWTLREFQLRKVCNASTSMPFNLTLADDDSSIATISPMFMLDDLVVTIKEPEVLPALPADSCKLVVQPVSVKNNPFKDLWRAGHPLSVAYQDDFVVEENLALLLPTPDGVNEIKMFDDELYNAGESIASGGELGPNIYEPDASFATDIEMSPPVPGSGLTASDVAHRAETQSCAGCHSLSNNQDLGNGVQWPSTLGFVHVDESSNLSFALTGPGMFLDHRAGVMEEFLNKLTCNTDCISSAVISAPDGSLLTVAPMQLAPTELTIGGSITH